VVWPLGRRSTIQRGSVQGGRAFRLDVEEIASPPGETDVTGRISKIGDVRTIPYEAANIILIKPVRDQR